MSATDDTIEALKKAQEKPSDDLAKATYETQGFSQQSGLNHYDLEAPAKKLYPVITPLRNMIPRVAGNGDTATRWRAITAINTTNMRMGVQEGARSGQISQKTVDYSAAYKGIGLESFCTFESEYSSQGFDDVRARAVEGLLRSFFIGEEFLILGGNSSVALGKPVTPTLTAQTTPAGNLASGTAINVHCVPLTLDGLRGSSIAGGVPRQESRAPADGGAAVTINAGSGEVSDAATVTPSAGSSSIFATTTPIDGAAAYAWYWGAAGSELLGAITTVAHVLITDTATGTENVSVHTTSAADYSQDSTVFDGVLTQIATSGSNSYIEHLDNGTAASIGTKLTSDGAGGIEQIDKAFRHFWDEYRLSPDLMIVSAQELNNITAILMANGGQGGTFFRYGLDGAADSVESRTITAGQVVGQYLNKFTMAGGQMVKVMLHPNMPAGTILFYSTSIPYPLSNVDNLMQIKARKNYYQIEFPLRTRRYEFGVYADELLQCYFPPAYGVITNIADGTA